MKAKNLTGLTFNRLTALYTLGEKQNGKYFWVFICSCGNTIKAVGASVTSGNTKSCGCLNIDNITKHGDSGERLYSIWRSMKYRCFNKNNTNYKYYGARGIKVCDRWMDYENFRNDMLPTYDTLLTLDRINVNGNYEPSNCKWATREEQDNNTRKSVLISSPWGLLSAAQCARKIGIDRSTMLYRIKHSFPSDLMFSSALKRNRKAW